MGHVKSICINFGLGRNYGGVCHLRCDDTDPEKEDTEYINGIIDSVRWRGFDRGQNAKTAPKPYFDVMYSRWVQAKTVLIVTGSGKPLACRAASPCSPAQRWAA